MLHGTRIVGAARAHGAGFLRRGVRNAADALRHERTNHSRMKFHWRCAFVLPVLVVVFPLFAQGGDIVPLSRDRAEERLVTSVISNREAIRAARQADWDAGQVKIGDRIMRFERRAFGVKPEVGRTLFISLHGGGNTSAETNDQQWKNQADLYSPAQGVYIAPRAPTDTWNLWHEAHVDAMIDRLIEDAVVFEDVNPDRVYLLGYSAGGDGVYQLAPRMADRFAAAAMMAGHPNEAGPINLANVPFAIWVGENDSAYNRNTVARTWAGELDELASEFPTLYTHSLHVVEGAGHWMNGADAAALSWMSGFSRDAWPKVVRWQQDDVLHDRLYWLGLDAAGVAAHRASKGVIGARVEGNEISLNVPDGVQAVTLYLSDRLVDLDHEVRIRWNDQPPLKVRVQRSDEIIRSEISARLDMGRAATAMYRVDRPAGIAETPGAKAPAVEPDAAAEQPERDGPKAP